MANGKITVAQLESLVTMNRADFERGYTQTNAEINNLGRSFDALEAKSKSSMAGAAEGVSGFGGAVKNALGSFGGFAPAMLAGAGAAGIAAVAIGSVGSALGGIVQQSVGGNAAMEQYAVGFEVLLGSADAARERIGELFKFAATTPFEMGEVVRADRVLQTFGGTALATGKNLTLIGDIASAAQRPFEEVAMWVGRTYDALQSGRPWGEAAMRLQEMGVLSGKARGELEAMTKAGASGNQVWAAFTQDMSRFNGMMEQQSHTLTGLASTIKDNVGQALRTAGAPLFDLLKQGAEFLVRDDVQAALSRFAKGLAGVVTILVDVGRVVMTVFGPALTIAGAILGVAADGADAFAKQLDKIAPIAEDAAHKTTTAMQSAASGIEQAGMDAGSGYMDGVAQGIASNKTAVVTGADGITRVLDISGKAADAGKAAGKAYTEDGLTTTVTAGKDGVAAATASVVGGMDQSAAAQEQGRKTGEGWLHGFLSTQIVSQDDLKKFLATDVGDALKQAASNWWNAQQNAFKEAGAALAPGAPGAPPVIRRDPDAGTGNRTQGVPPAPVDTFVDRRDAQTRDAARRVDERASDVEAKGAVVDANRAVAAAAAAEAKKAADEAERAYRATPAGQIQTAIEQARTDDAVSRLKANNKEYIDTLVQGQVDANKARDAMEKAQKAAGLIQQTSAERDAQAAKDKAAAAFKATPAGQIDTAIQQAQTDVEISKLKATNKKYIDAVVQGQLEANKARDALEIAQKAAGLIEYTTLEQEAKRKQSDAVSALQSTLDFFVKAADFKTDIRGNVNLILDQLDYTLKAVVARSATWKAAATDEIGKVAANIKVVGEALSAALNPLSLVDMAGDVTTWAIDAAFSNVDYILTKLDKLAADPRFQGARLQRLVDLSAGMTYAFAGIKGAVDTVSSIGETQQKVDSGEISYGFDQIYSAFGAQASNGGGAGGGTVNNYNWNGTIVATPEMRTLIEQFFQYLRDTGGGQMVGAPN